MRKKKERGSGKWSHSCAGMLVELIKTACLWESISHFRDQRNNSCPNSETTAEHTDRGQGCPM